MKADIISLERLDELDELAPAFVGKFRQTFPPPEHVSLKLHVMEAHLCDHARRFGSLGLFNEAGAESIHALVNELERRFACVKGVDKDEAIIRALQQQQNALVQEKKAARTERRRRAFRAPRS